MFSEAGLTHELQRPHSAAVMFEEQRVEVLGAAEVDDFDGVHGADDDVVGLNVQVQNAAVV